MTTCCFGLPSTSPEVSTETKRKSSPLAGTWELGVRRRVPHSWPEESTPSWSLMASPSRQSFSAAGVEADHLGGGAVRGVGSGDGADEVSGDEAERAAGQEDGGRQGHVSHG